MSELVWGKNSVNEALKSNRVQELYCLEGSPYIAVCKKAKIDYIVKKRQELDKLTGGGNHQGVVCKTFAYDLYDLEDIIKKENGLIVMLDGLEDPRNLGAIIRTCDCAGVDGIIYRKDRSVHITPTVFKVASGALEYVKVVEVTNLTETLKKLKEHNYWVVGTDASGQELYSDIDYDMNTVIVIGSEGKGISRLVAKECDRLVKMPLFGHVNSLNASVACGIMLYEVIRNRTYKH